ncbi:thioredoxin-like protein [Desarmillaria ectypa]|nr:thioredoxin-like protein [Desarmillaria ectypa]
MAWVMHIDDAQELRKMISAQQHTVVFFHQPWCSHCKKMEPIFDMTASLVEYKGVKFCEFDLEEQEDVMEEMDIMTFPKIVVFHQGEKIAATGPRELEAFKTWLSAAIARQETVNASIECASSLKALASINWQSTVREPLVPEGMKIGEEISPLCWEEASHSSTQRVVVYSNQHRNPMVYRSEGPTKGLPTS